MIMTPPKMPSRRSPNSNTMTRHTDDDRVEQHQNVFSNNRRSPAVLHRLTAPRAALGDSGGAQARSSIVRLSAASGNPRPSRCEPATQSRGDRQSHDDDSSDTDADLRRPLGSSTAVDKRQGDGVQGLESAMPVKLRITPGHSPGTSLPRGIHGAGAQTHEREHVTRTTRNACGSAEDHAGISREAEHGQRISC